jgi:hypothetical protein
MKDYLKIYTIEELNELKKGFGTREESLKDYPGYRGRGQHGRGPDKQKRKSRGMQTSGGKEWQVEGSGVKEEKAKKPVKPQDQPEKGTSWSAKSLGDCYTIDELYQLKKGKVYDPAAVAAAIGRKKYGAKKFAEMSAAGKKRKKAPKGKAKMAPGGGGRFAKLESEIEEKNKGKK